MSGKAETDGLAFARFVLGRRGFLLGYMIVAAVILITILAPWLAPYSPITADAGAYLLPPGGAHPMGTDTAGLDIFSRVLYAPRIDLAIALLATAAAVMAGGSLGAIAGLADGRRGLSGVLATGIVRSADVIQAFPVFGFALVLVAVLGQGVTALVLAIAIVNTPLYLRLMRSQVLVLRQQAFVEAAVIAGASAYYLLLRHIVPNALSTLIAQISNNIAAAILLTAGLSFIGAGVRAPAPEWGSMIAMGFANVVTGQWWPSLFPGIALALTVLGFGLIAGSIEAYADPRERTRPSPRAWRRFSATQRAADSVTHGLPP
jgi:peptide/nickel transport system permease protein